MGINIGDEENGKGEHFKRPALVYKKLGRNLFLGIPLNSVPKGESLFYCRIKTDATINTSLVSHIKCMDSKRLNQKMCRVSSEGYEKIKQAIRKLTE